MHPGWGSVDQGWWPHLADVNGGVRLVDTNGIPYDHSSPPYVFTGNVGLRFEVGGTKVAEVETIPPVMATIGKSSAANPAAVRITQVALSSPRNTCPFSVSALACLQHLSF